MYPYAAVEMALAEVFHAKSGELGALRGRIKHFQRIGLALSSPGKGKKISYELISVFLWALALEFSEFGIDSTTIKRFLSGDIWNYIAIDIRDHERVGSEYLIFYPHLVSAFHSHLDNRVPYEFVSDVKKLAETVSRPVETGDLFDRRFGVIHIGQLWRALIQALEAATKRGSASSSSNAEGPNDEATLG